MTTESDVIKEYNVADGRITNPGKFEGEPAFVPYFWGVGLDGFADDDDGKAYRFRITAEDKEKFPSLARWAGRRRSFRLIEDGSGFVRAV